METSTSSSHSRFLKGRRQEATAEIEGWIASTRAETIKVGAARSANQPSKNITEQKMLDSKLYDMSKQRFNFVLQCQWQRKLFIEKQKRKTVVMRDLLKNVDVSATSENPFTTVNKRRGTTVIPAARYHQTVTMPTKAATTVPRPRATPTETCSTDTDVFKFVTEKEASKADTDDASLNQKITEKQELPSRFKSWPMCDSRFHKLNEALSNNYSSSLNSRSGKSKLYLTPSHVSTAKVF